jgi:beta-galactosidase
MAATPGEGPSKQRLPLTLQASAPADEALSINGSRGVHFGAAYYWEYQPVERLELDLDLMAQAGFTVIRVGESVWSTWEPEAGVFELDWLEPVLDAAYKRGIRAIVGTPTYAVPPWLQRRYPELAANSRTGRPIPWGARQEIDFTHPGFRFHAERIVRAVVGRYAPHPGVIGFQLDNEPGLELMFNRGVFERFRDHLRQRYGEVGVINREWGLNHWSHRLSTWADLWTPDGNTSPQYDLAWRRFQAALTSEYIGWQVDIARTLVRPGQFLTTCIDYSRPAVDDVELSRCLDRTSGNAYFGTQDALSTVLATPRGGHDEPPLAQGWSRLGAFAVFSLADRMYASRQAPFFVTETNAATIGGPAMNFPPYPGQLRQLAWAMIGRGARMIEYWHWHTLHWGAETYWGGILPHSENPGRIYEEVAELGKELAAVGHKVTACRPDADVAILYSLPSKWALEFMPPFAVAGAVGHWNAYDEIFDAMYRGMFDAGCQVRVLNDSQLGDIDPLALVADVPVLAVPAFYCAEDASLDFLLEYARGGGHVVLGTRTAYADADGRARHEVAPARLVQAAGLHYDEYSNLMAPAGVVAVKGCSLAVPGDARATRWVDGLITSEAEMLASYVHPFFGRWCAIATNPYGSGRVTTVGTVPNKSLAKALASWLVPEPRTGEWRQTDAVRVHSVTAPGTRILIVHNFSAEEAVINCPQPVTDILGNRELDKGAELVMGPWGVHVLGVEG